MEEENKILSDAHFANIYDTEKGRQAVCIGWMFNDKKYVGVIFEGHCEISLYTEDGYGPYCFSVGSGSVIKPTKSSIDRIVGLAHYTHDDRDLFVRTGHGMKCVKPIVNVKSGTGCNPGEIYNFEYVYPQDKSEAFKPFYRKISDNTHYDEVYITDDELLDNFKMIMEP